MVSSPSPPPPPTITVLHQECQGEVSLRQLAQSLRADVSNVRKAKNWLIENRHPSFNGYVPESPLSPEQADTIVLFRSYTTQGIKGDVLTERMFPDVATANAKKEALRDLFEQENIPPEQAARLTHSVLRIYNR